MPQIVIIGAGVGGMAFAIALKRRLGFTDFQIFEKASDVGGTWRDNIYPGASSDSSIRFYSLPSDLSPDWPSTHGSQPDTLAYWKQLAEKYRLYAHIAFDHLVTSAEWDADQNVWHVVTQDALGVRSTTTARILISALGILEVPRYPDIAGIDSFKGSVFHSARWDDTVELQGKRVAVIGNGASATQFVPIISKDPTVQVTQFCRTPNWYLPNIRANYSPWSKWIVKHVPFALQFNWFNGWLGAELFYLAAFHHPSMSKGFKKLAEGYITRTAPKEDLPKLIPKYAPGCKRIVFDIDFLPSLHRPNLALNWDGIQSICEEGIITNNGDKLAFDVIIFATGFVADRFPLEVHGTAGRTIQDYYDTQGGPKAYIGTTVPGFPNFFMLAGPNTGTGHTSVIYTEGLQIDYSLNFIEPLLAGAASSFEVTHAATDRYNNTIQRMLARSVHTTCTSWYRVGGTGRITNIFPGPGTLFWWWTRRVKWSDYKVVGARGWTWRVWRRDIKRAFILALAIGMGFYVRYGRGEIPEMMARSQVLTRMSAVMRAVVKL
ncbi:FAD/NAD-binding domain-containing protein [Roridomyces roridus]|uniref:FAD/NAD-binding domain-containing protein n=1 Tax=Roridomyces roridus TaxID=1738132 RepID=A0AAD7B771_9AGAR|nr:FAD/NAD-binding domain-containing protein [Roridomyces roridus]